MKLKGLVDEDFVNYKLPSMFIATSKCSFKCDAECGRAVCQNLPLAAAPVIEVGCAELVDRYMSNNISKAVVIGGLEAFDDGTDLMDFIREFRSRSDDDIVIYTLIHNSWQQKTHCYAKNNNTRQAFKPKGIFYNRSHRVKTHAHKKASST